jgi:AbrB family looped-hinge helix DNA binding protein
MLLDLIYLMSQTVHVGKRYAVYIPKRVAEGLNIREGDALILDIEDDRISLKPVRKAKVAESWTSVEPEEIEAVGEELTRRILE